MKECKHLDEFDRISQHVEKFDDGYAISGCCGGGCFVITGITHCPFCGVKLL